MSTLLEGRMDNLCFSGPFAHYGEQQGLSVFDDVDLLPDYGLLDLLDVNAIAEVFSDDSKGSNHSDNNACTLSSAPITPATNSCNNADVIDAINCAINFPELTNHSLTAVFSNSNSGVSVSTTAGKASSSASDDITIVHPVSSPTSIGDNVIGKALCPENKRSATSNTAEDASKTTSPLCKERHGCREAGRVKKTTPQSTTVYDSRARDGQTPPSAHPVLTTCPATVLPAVDTSTFTASPSNHTVPHSSPLCSPFAFNPPLSAQAMTGPRTLCPTTTFTTKALNPTYTPPPIVNMAHFARPTSIFAQTPTITLMPEAAGHVSQTRSRSPGDWSTSWSSASGRQLSSLPSPQAGWLGSETLYSSRRAAANEAFRREMEEFREHVRAQKSQRLRGGDGRAEGNDITDKTKRISTMCKSLQKLNPQTRLAPYQKPPHKQKKRQLKHLSQKEELQLRKLQQRKELQELRQGQKSLMQQQQQELNNLLQRHSREQHQQHQQRQQLERQSHQTRQESSAESLENYQKVPDQQHFSADHDGQDRAKAQNLKPDPPDRETEDMESTLTSCYLPAFPSSPLSSSFSSHVERESKDTDDLYHFDGYRMAPGQNNTYDFFVAETPSSDAQSDTEDSNIDSLLQQFKPPSYQEPQQSVSDVCGVSDVAEGYDLMCDQSSAHLTIDDNVRSLVTSASDACELPSPSHSSAFVSQSPQSVSNSSVAATAGTLCDLNWPSVTDDEAVTEGRITPPKGEKRKKLPGSSPRPGRQLILNYQTMTPWTNEDLVAQEAFPSPSREIPCFPLDGQTLREPALTGQSPAVSTVQQQSSLFRPTAVTETVYSLKSTSPNLSVQGHADRRSPVKRSQNQVSSDPHVSREKRFRKTAEALHKCGLWDIAMKTGELIRRNAQLQKEIERFRAEAVVFLKAVVQNPENKELMESLSKGAPLTLGQRACVTSSSALDTAITTGCMTNKTVSDSNSSTTSGYASYTEHCSKRTCPTRKE